MTSIDGMRLEEWATLPAEEQIRIVQGLNPYAGQGAGLVRSIYGAFVAEYGTQEGILDSGFGAYHGGYYAITVLTDASCNAHFPESYQGVPVVQMCTHAGRMLREKLGSDYDEVAEYVDRYYESVVGELERQALTLETASKDQIVQAVEAAKRQAASDGAV